MSLAVILTRANIGIESPLVRVEAHLSNGLPCFTIVGLPEMAVRESRERVRSAILNARLEFPDKRITLNLAPAELPKSGGRYDLAIAVGILAASGQLPMAQLQSTEFLGELALSGEIRGVSAVLPAALAARQAGHAMIIPAENSAEAGLVRDVDSRTAAHLLDVIGHLAGRTPLPGVISQTRRQLPPGPDMQDIIGQQAARRALAIAAAGGHNLLMQGPPGTGKTMLATRLGSILPALDEARALEVAAVRSIANTPFDPNAWEVPPFRAPHHTASAVALVGGGSSLKVGEISLAHNVVLFLDELPEFSPKVLEVLREPLESGYINIARASYQVRLPARFQLIAAMNPCPCGSLGDPDKICRCTPDRIRQYQGRVSGPLLDRIDLHIPVPRLRASEKTRLLESPGPSSEASKAIRERVTVSQQRQLRRAGKTNAWLDPGEIRRDCRLSVEDEDYLTRAMTQLKLSTRSFFRILKISRTIADLEGAGQIERQHLLEAISLRFPGSQLE